MMTNDRQDKMERMKRPANVFAGNGMELHHFPFLGREPGASLLKNLVGHGNFAEIVQVAAALKGDDGIFIHAEVAAKISGVNGETLAVTFSVRIASFDNQTESAQDGIGGLQFVGELFQAEQRFDAGDEFFGKNGLVEEIVGP